MHALLSIMVINVFSMAWLSAVSSPIRLTHWAQALVFLINREGFKSLSWHLCPSARHLTIIALPFGWHPIITKLFKRYQNIDSKVYFNPLPNYFYLKILFLIFRTSRCHSPHSIHTPLMSSWSWDGMCSLRWTKTILAIKCMRYSQLW